MLPLRICYLKNECMLDEECRYQGGAKIKKGMNEVLKSIFYVFNATFIPKTDKIRSVWDDPQDKLDPCLKSLQRNESDIVFLPYSMPVILENTTIGAVTYESKLGLISAYTFESHDFKPAILGTFGSFSLDVCVFILHFLLFLYGLLASVRILEQKRSGSKTKVLHSLSWIPELIFSFFVKQFHSSPGNASFSKAIITCCLLGFSFYVTYFYSSMIKTDMVTVKTPHVIASYQDIIDDPDVKPYIMHILDEYQSFKFAPAGSAKRKIWERIVKNGLDKYILESKNPENGMAADQDLASTKGVIIAYSNAIAAIKYLAMMRVKKTNLRILIAFDPSENAVMSAFVMNKLASKEILLPYEVRGRRMLQADLYTKMTDSVGKVVGITFGEQMSFGKDISNLESFVSERILLPESVVVKPDILYFKELFISLVGLYLLAFIVLLIERYIFKKQRD